MTEQLELVPAATRCGYCGLELVLQPEGDYACPRCRPLLRRIRTADEWARFQREAARRG